MLSKMNRTVIRAIIIEQLVIVVNRPASIIRHMKDVLSKRASYTGRRRRKRLHT